MPEETPRMPVGPIKFIETPKAGVRRPSVAIDSLTHDLKFGNRSAAFWNV